MQDWCQQKYEYYVVCINNFEEEDKNYVAGMYYTHRNFCGTYVKFHGFCGMHLIHKN